MTAKEAIATIRKAKEVYVVTRLTNDDMYYAKGIKTDLIEGIKYFANKYHSGTVEFNVTFVKDRNEAIVG